MIKLTALHYKLKTPSLERYHNIAEHNSSRLFEWEVEKERASVTGQEYPKKPFIEPFEFKDEDYTITEKPFRVKKENIISYKENVEGVVEIVITSMSEDVAYTVKEDILQLDAILDV